MTASELGTATAAKPTGRTLKVGVAGLGAGAVAVVRAMEHSPHLELVAAAEIRPEARDAFQQRYGGRAYDSVEKLCQDPDVEVIWVSTPNQYHAEHTIMAANHGKHIVAEKPMALSLEEAEAMVEAAERNGVRLLCGHTASLMAAYQSMRDIVRAETLGKVCAINVWSYTDWIFRPRLPQEVTLETGGGVPYRQGPHQVDTVRLIGGGRVRSVRATTGQWFAGRRVPGYYSAFLDFEEGHCATIVHNGYGYFSTFELVPWAGPTTVRPSVVRLRKSLRANGPDSSDEMAAKNERRFGGTDEDRQSEVVPGEQQRARGFQGDLGIVLVSCERGDIRQSPTGLYVYDDDGQRDVPVAGIDDERMAELDEMYEAVTQNRPVRHDGRWGMATLEVVLAIMQSGRERREIVLSHQSPAY
jgi:phthalate 4,5-cis-dihydrodiol dehydrogenase